jgi:hypothetical protein
MSVLLKQRTLRRSCCSEFEPYILTQRQLRMMELLESVTSCQQSSVKTTSHLRIAMQRQPFIDDSLNLERGFRQSPALHGLPKTTEQQAKQNSTNTSNC